MDAHTLLEDIINHGISLRVEADTLVAQPASRLTPEHRHAIRQHKAALIALLATNDSAASAPERKTPTVHQCRDCQHFRRFTYHRHLGYCGAGQIQVAVAGWWDTDPRHCDAWQEAPGEGNAMSASQRRKGANGERELAALLRDHLGMAIERNLQQTSDGGHDLNGPALERFAVEVKRAAEPKLSAWWAQACEQAGGGRVPVLAYRIDRHSWYFVMPLGALHPGFDAGDHGMTATLGLEEFVAVVREGCQ
ncbi:hypothetical protein CCP3SC15_530007 [Gammaproteobacteria bacterium]